MRITLPIPYIFADLEFQPSLCNGSILYLCTGRLSKEEIEKMVRDAERYKEEDEKQRDRLQAKNALESYAFNMKQTIEDDKLKDKISDDDRKTVLDKCNEVIQWIDGNQVHTLHYPWFYLMCTLGVSAIPTLTLV